MANLNLNGNVSEKEKVLQVAYKDLIAFGKLFSPQDFLASATPPFHVEVGKRLLNKENSQLALVLPRDHAKSTLASAAVLHRFLFAPKMLLNLYVGLVRLKTKLVITWLG